MHIRKAHTAADKQANKVDADADADADADGIKNLYLQAFDASEAQLVSELAVDLLDEKLQLDVLSLLAIENDAIVGHVAFSPVFFGNKSQDLANVRAYLLAPLAVLPAYQNKRIGSALVKQGLDRLAASASPSSAGASGISGASMVFVYGDPAYYARFGFSTDLAQNYTAPYALQYPHGWQAMLLNGASGGNGAREAADAPEAGTLHCVEPLNKPALW